MEKTLPENSEEFLDKNDALIAAPNSHKVLFENEKVRVLEVTIPPGKKEPPHVHKFSSVMIVDEPTDIRYFDKDDQPQDFLGRDGSKVEWLEPEGMHAVENLDKEKPYRAIRVELK